VQPGGYSFNATPAPTSFDHSDAWQYELGLGATTTDGKWSGRITGFYTDIHDYQVFRPTGFGNFTMLNAERAHTVGAELELTAKPAKEWQFTLGGGLVSAKFDEFTDPVTAENFKDKNINLVPKYTLNASVSWHPDDHWFVQVSEQVIGDFDFDEANTAGQSAYGLLNFRVGWQDKHWGVAGFGQNVLDQRYASTAFHFNQPPAGNYFLTTPGRPAMFGIELFARF
jgi:iron complex outermembrane receptor protein